MDEHKIRQTEINFAQSIDGLTVAEIADRAIRSFYEMAETARRLAHENEKLRRQAA